jgi:CBS domain-containing protein
MPGSFALPIASSSSTRIRSISGPTTDDRPFFFHTTRLADQFDVAFGKSMLFGNGLSALLTLFGISAALVALFVIGPLDRWRHAGSGWRPLAAYFGALARDSCCSRSPCFSGSCCCSATRCTRSPSRCFSLLLGTGLGSVFTAWLTIAGSPSDHVGLLAIVVVALVTRFAIPRLVDAAIPWPLAAESRRRRDSRPVGILLGMALPGGMRLLAARGRNSRRGVGAERRVFRRGRHAGRLHCDELGLLDHVSGGGGRLRRRGRGVSEMSLLDLVRGAPSMTSSSRRSTACSSGAIRRHRPVVPALEHLTLKRPIVSANMDTITRAEMAIAVAEEGGIGIIDRGFRSGDIEPQVREVERVKRRQHGIIVDPYTIRPEAPLAEAIEMMSRTGVGTLVVVDEARRVVGLLTARDLRFSGSDGRVRDRMTPSDELIVREGVIDSAAAEDVMRAHKIKKLPLVDTSGRLLGLVTAGT